VYWCNVVDAHVTIYELEAAGTEYVAVCCSVLQRVAVCSSVMKCVAVCCIFLRYGAAYVVACCSGLQCVANVLVRCRGCPCHDLQTELLVLSVLRCVKVYCSVWQCDTVCCSVLQCFAV